MVRFRRKIRALPRHFFSDDEENLFVCIYYASIGVENKDADEGYKCFKLLVAASQRLLLPPTTRLKGSRGEGENGRHGREQEGQRRRRKSSHPEAEAKLLLPSLR